jgi:hypothetical protein
MVTMLGMLALAVDASFMYTERNRMSAAADAAAKGAAQELRRGVSANLQAFANREVTMHGLTPSPGGDTTVAVATPPTEGAFVGQTGYVQVRVSRPTATFFARILDAGWSSLTPTAFAVAGASPSPTCIYVLGNDPDALSLANNVVVDMPNCGIQDGGGAAVGNSANTHIITSGVSIAVGSCPSPSVMPNCIPNGAPPLDPLVTLPPPADPGPALLSACPAENIINGPVTLNPGRYCGIQFNSGSVLTMTPGTYYMTGPIHPRNPGTDLTWNGSGVMIFLASSSGQLDLESNHVTVNLSAPTSGTYKGILFYQERGNTNPATLSKNNAQGMTLSGALYFPDAHLSMKNNNGVVVNDCTVIVARTIDFNNNSEFGNPCSAYGGSPLMTVTLAE